MVIEKKAVSYPIFKELLRAFTQPGVITLMLCFNFKASSYDWFENNRYLNKYSTSSPVRLFTREVSSAIRSRAKALFLEQCNFYLKPYQF